MQLAVSLQCNEQQCQATRFYTPLAGTPTIAVFPFSAADAANVVETGRWRLKQDNTGKPKQQQSTILTFTEPGVYRYVVTETVHRCNKRYLKTRVMRTAVIVLTVH